MEVGFARAELARLFSTGFGDLFLAMYGRNAWKWLWHAIVFHMNRKLSEFMSSLIMRLFGPDLSSLYTLVVSLALKPGELW